MPDVSMPDLSDLDSLKKELIPVLLIGADAALGPKDRLHLRTFIRLIDKAVDEYRDARKALIDEITAEEDAKSGKQGAMVILSFAFIDHIENCITSTRRILRTFDRIKGNNPNLIDRQTNRLITNLSADITAVRDVLEHIDERIHSDEIESNEPVILALSESRDKVFVGSATLRLDQLGSILKKMHNIARGLLSATPRQLPN